MNEHIALIWKKLDHLARMREYLRYSMSQVAKLLPIDNWQVLQPDQHSIRLDAVLAHHLGPGVDLAIDESFGFFNTAA